ncbi:MAG: DUF1631 family protein, partial [Hydrogenophaga sp.]
GAGGTAVAQQDGVPADELAALLASLHVGGWVDLFSDGRWLRAQLVWASTKGSLFMFTSRGGRAHTMTRRVCEKLLTQRWLRPVATRPVVPQALRAMAEQPPEDVQAREPVSA